MQVLELQLEGHTDPLSDVAALLPGPDKLFDLLKKNFGPLRCRHRELYCLEWVKPESAPQTSHLLSCLNSFSFFRAHDFRRTEGTSVIKRAKALAPNHSATSRLRCASNNFPVLNLSTPTTKRTCDLNSWRRSIEFSIQNSRNPFLTPIFLNTRPSPQPALCLRGLSGIEI
jgi:hypothetical protein